jgi:phytoene desaturase
MSALKLLTTPLRIGVFGNFARLIDSNIRSEKLRQVLYQYATYSGASPFLAPATLAVIPYAEMSFGGWYIPGGMYKLAEAIEAVARKVGVEIHTSRNEAQIVIEPCNDKRHLGRAKGALTDSGELFHADFVIANSDVVYTYRQLIDAQYRKKFSDPTLDKIEPGGSGVVLMLGVEGTYPQLAHHNKFMPDDYSSDVRAMFQTHTVPDDPYIYLCAATRSDPTQAPDGCETLFVMAGAPALDGTIDWAVQGPRYRDKLVQMLETKWELTDLSKRIAVERIITPADLKDLYNANAGTIYGIGSNSRRTAFLRPPNRDRDIQGLFFVGGATHPGGGLPLVALSGKIVAELIAADEGISV